MLAAFSYRGASSCCSRRPLATLFLSSSSEKHITKRTTNYDEDNMKHHNFNYYQSPPPTYYHTTITSRQFSSSSFSALPPDEEMKEKLRVGSLTPYQKEMELRQLDSEVARLQTLRGINTGELYTFRGQFKMLARDYGMGFMAWYWTVWCVTAGLSYAAIEVGGVDPLLVAAKVETFMGWETASISGRVDPTLGHIGLALAVNECLEPLRLPLVVVTTKPMVDFISGKR